MRARGGAKFLVATLLVATLVVTFGWLGSAREVMHGALLATATLAFLPFVALATILLAAGAVTLLVTLLGILTGDPIDVDLVPHVGEALANTAPRWTVRYYRFLASRRHPVVWGAALGVLSGGVVLWGLVGLVIVPGEAETATVLANARARIERSYQEHRFYPAPDAPGRLLLDGTPVMDGFGRPLRYEVTGRGKFASWKLVSRGFDGRESADDLCVEGATRLGTLAKGTERALDRLRGKDASLRDQLASVGKLRCDGGRRISFDPHE